MRLDQWRKAELILSWISLPCSTHELVRKGRYDTILGREGDNEMCDFGNYTEDTIAFSVLENIRPMIETVPLEQAADAYARMMQGKARFRMVLVTKDGTAKKSSAN